jgi:hypothetical protein
VTQDEAPRLMTLRTRLLVIGAIRGADGRQQILRLGLRGHWRQRFAALLQRIAALAVSTVAQFAADQKNPPPKPWKPRQSRFQPKLTSSVQMMFLGLISTYLDRCTLGRSTRVSASDFGGRASETCTK